MLLCVLVRLEYKSIIGVTGGMIDKRHRIIDLVRKPQKCPVLWRASGGHYLWYWRNDGDRVFIGVSLGRDAGW